MNASNGAPEPFLDWYGIWPGATGYEHDGRAWVSEAPHGVELSVQPAERSEPFLFPDQPWEAGGLNHLYVRHKDGRYRMWYVARSPEGELSMLYAESEDGFHWTKPQLGLYEFAASKENNITLPCRGGSVFVDPSAPEAERYKRIGYEEIWHLRGKRISEDEGLRLLLELQEKGYTREQMEVEPGLVLRGQVHGAVSPDGLHWTKIEEPVLPMFCDTQNIAYYDQELKKYVGYFRVSFGRRRSVGRAETDDFCHWPKPQIVLHPDLQDPITDDFYTSSFCWYPGGKYRLMFPAVYHRVKDTLDIQLATSRDGFNWTRPQRVPIVSLGPGEHGLYASPEMVPLGQDRWAIPYNTVRRRHNEGYYYPLKPGDGVYRWAMWKRDRLVALQAPVEGRVTLIPQQCQGERMSLNYRTEPNGWIRVELINPTLWPPVHLESLPGHSFADCEPLRGDSLAGEVRWSGSADLSAFRGQNLCVRIWMCRARLFSISM